MIRIKTILKLKIITIKKIVIKIIKLTHFYNNYNNNNNLEDDD